VLGGFVRNPGIQTKEMPLRLSGVVVLMLSAATASAGQFIPLGGLGGGQFLSEAEAVSADGRVVVGRAGASDATYEAFQWTREGGLVGLGDLLGRDGPSRAWDVSGDGSAIVGFATSRDLSRKGFLLRDNTPQFLGSRTNATAVSMDASTVVGFFNTSGGGLGAPFRWTEASGTETIPLPAGQSNFVPSGISEDGELVVGWGNASGFDSTHGFRWSAVTGFRAMGTLPGSPYDLNLPSDVSPDGSVIVGISSSAPDGNEQAFRWTQATGLESLGSLPDRVGISSATATSLDGQLVVGRFIEVESVNSRAFLWDQVHGMRDLRQVLIDDFALGSVLENWSLSTATDITPDGRTIVGWGVNPDGIKEGWLAFLSATMTGDYNQNGELDVDDLDRQAQAIRGGTNPPEYDLNGDGVVDYDGDRIYWLHELKRTWVGDANLDGQFDSSDFVQIFEVGKYEMQQAANWSEGDWSGDGVFDSADFVIAFQDGGYEQGPRAVVAAVPEPASWTWWVSGLLLGVRTRLPGRRIARGYGTRSVPTTFGA
jgi:probable HAF family extracellular repeat protein